MYDIRQFIPTLYFLVLLGITGFSLAAEEAALWVLATAGLMANAWLVRTKRFTPLPRWLSNGITLIALAYVTNQVMRSSGTPILLIGQFLVLLQIIKLFEQRGNRDYAQLLVLSLLLMVAAAISTASLLFGVLLIFYLFVSLYCCLLFHLKMETDAAKAAQTVTPERLNLATLRQDQRYLSRSMRRLTALVSMVSLTSAVIVFVFFPRGAGAGMFGQLQLHPPQVLTGFSDHVGFQQVAKITQNNEVVAHVKVSHNGVPVAGNMALLLRGTTLNKYGAGRGKGTWQWWRGEETKPMASDLSADATVEGSKAFSDPGGKDEWRQNVILAPTGTAVLFALAGPVSFRPTRDVRLVYSPQDLTIQVGGPLTQPIEYDVVSRGSLGNKSYRNSIDADPRPSRIDTRIREYAMRPDVAGEAARRRVPPDPVSSAASPLDEAIAGAIERHLRTSFTYTLDLSDAEKLAPDEDPMVAFLYRLKRGHCEYFAGAMALMCQSLGMQARVVVGFKCDEFNSVGGYYIVRQSHAHAWVEVLTTQNGWETFDPTSSNEAPQTKAVGAWESIKHFFDFLEYKWANAVVAYDADRRDNMIQSMDRTLTRTAIKTSESISRWRRWLDKLAEGIDQNSTFWLVSSKVLGGIIALMVIVIAAAIAWYFWEQARIRRRAAKIGLDALPMSVQMRLARQLGFYAELTQLLEGQGITRPRHLTPREFSRSLSFLPSDAFSTVDRLTRIFYRVRYGQAQVQPAQQRRLATVVTRLGETLRPKSE